VRLSRCEVRDHINHRKNDRRRSYRFYRALQRLKSPMRYICEIFGAPRFSSFSTQSTQSGQSMAFWLEQISLESHGTWIKSEMQPASNDVALRTHGDVFDRGVNIASGAFQSAAFEDSACACFCSQRLHNA
jgi:hypothetical protein